MAVQISTKRGIYGLFGDWMHWSIGTPKVEPSGAVGELGELAPCWILRNCFATRPRHVLDLGLVQGSKTWEFFRVLLAGDWPVGERLRDGLDLLFEGCGERRLLGTSTEVWAGLAWGTACCLMFAGSWSEK